MVSEPCDVITIPRNVSGSRNAAQSGAGCARAVLPTHSTFERGQTCSAHHPILEGGKDPDTEYWREGRTPTPKENPDPRPRPTEMIKRKACHILVRYHSKRRWVWEVVVMPVMGPTGVEPVTEMMVKELVKVVAGLGMRMRARVCVCACAYVRAYVCVCARGGGGG